MDKIKLINIKKAYGTNVVIENCNLDIKDGSFTVLLGPSGCGKSTTLRMIAGLEKESGGEIRIDGVNVCDLEPGDRNIAMVFQNYALYPTMNVKENIEFGLKNSKVEKQERERRISEISKLVGLEQYLTRKPSQLSGGQRQRVALARAIVKNPSVFLMDEPLSNLDAKLRNQIRGDLIELYNKLKTTFVYVTHDQVEAMSMATDIVLMHDGKIMQQGSPNEIYNNPANVFCARFIGSPPMNIIVNGPEMKEKYPSLNNDKIGYIGFRPEKAFIAQDDCTLDGSLHFRGTLLTKEMLGDLTLYKVDIKVGIVYVKSFYEASIVYGEVSINVPMAACFYFDQNEQRLREVYE